MICLFNMYMYVSVYIYVYGPEIVVKQSMLKLLFPIRHRQLYASCQRTDRYLLLRELVDSTKLFTTVCLTISFFSKSFGEKAPTIKGVFNEYF